MQLLNSSSQEAVLQIEIIKIRSVHHASAFQDKVSLNSIVFIYQSSLLGYFRNMDKLGHAIATGAISKFPVFFNTANTSVYCKRRLRENIGLL